MAHIFRRIFSYVLKPTTLTRGRYFCDTDLVIDDDEVTNESNYVKLDRAFMSHLLPEIGHRVIIIQPARTHGKLYMKVGTEDQSLSEARALVRTLKKWIIVNEKRVNNRLITSTTFFTKGKYEELCEYMNKSDKDSTAVFLNWPYLSSLQISNMEKDWNKVVYDRYMMVLQIFKLHAITSEAKFQVQLAQIPYMKSRIFGYHTKSHSFLIRDSIRNTLQGIEMGTCSLEDKYFIIKCKEQKIRKRLKEIEARRSLQSTSRRYSNLPLISVVGYTNSGKTSLIHYLTKDEKIKPEDNFFATLDVTYHDCFLQFDSKRNEGMKSILIDTIGFLSEIPTQLVMAFKTTLSETVQTDLIIHVVDVSNPFWLTQMDFTLKVIKSLNLSDKLLNSVVTVGTKIDMISKSEIEHVKNQCENMILISNKTGQNIDIFKKSLISSILKNTDLIVKKIKVKQASIIYQWLRNNSIIQSEIPSKEDNNLLLLDILVTNNKWETFCNNFRNNKK